MHSLAFEMQAEQLVVGGVDFNEKLILLLKYSLRSLIAFVNMAQTFRILFIAHMCFPLAISVFYQKLLIKFNMLFKY